MAPSAPAPNAPVPARPQSLAGLDELLLGREVAQHLRCHERHLTRLHALGSGPPSVLVGKKRLYPLSGLVAWIAARKE